MSEKIEVYISEEEVRERVKRMADHINEEYAGKEVHLIGILKGSVLFLCELAKNLNMTVTMDFMSCSSYGSGTVSKGIVKITKDLDESIEGKHCIIVEDIIDSGNTLAYLTQQLSLRNPASLAIVTLLDKPCRRKKDIPVKHSCFRIDDKFVVGFGLDYCQKYRNLPYIGKIIVDGEEQ